MQDRKIGATRPALAISPGRQSAGLARFACLLGLTRGDLKHNPGVSAALSWSGGKDSALALHAQLGHPPRALIATMSSGRSRLSMHGVRRELIVRQAHATGIPLIEVEIPSRAANRVYEARLREALSRPPLREIESVIFGDLFLADIRAYREAQMDSLGRQAMFPLWHRDTRELAEYFLAEGFRAVIICVDPSQLDPSFAGRAFDAEFLEALPAGVDPCGEKGEFHTFVHSGPIFTEPIEWEYGEILESDGFVFCDLLPA